MKLARFKFDGKVFIGNVSEDGDSVEIIASESQGVDALIEFIKQDLIGNADVPGERRVDIGKVKLLQPIVMPSKNVICVGKNYIDHAKEFSSSGYDSSSIGKEDILPEFPIIFSKAACTLIGDGEDIVVPWDITEKVDYEAELGVIIGKGGRNIPKEKAYDHVWGYTVVNDMTARDLQMNHKQWFLGKSIDTFCPIGPWVVTADEVNPENLDVKCWVNDELRQNANTADLIFGIPSIIETVSKSMTLSPGDIIATGTPAGVGIGFSPAKFLHSGDVVRVEISSIGSITNQIK